MVEFRQPRRLRGETDAWCDVRAALCATTPADLGEEADEHYHRRPQVRTDRHAWEMRDVP